MPVYSVAEVLFIDKTISVLHLPVVTCGWFLPDPSVLIQSPERGQESFLQQLAVTMSYGCALRVPMSFW